MLVAPGVRVKLADFGIAGMLGVDSGPGPPHITVGPGEPDSSEDPLAATVDAPTMPPNPKLTATGALLGTPLYMAPEVIDGTSAIGPPADLFSFGLIAYQLLGGGAIVREGLRLRSDPTKRPSARELYALLSAARLV